MDTLYFYFYYFQDRFIGYPLVIKVTVFLVLTLITIYIASLFRIYYLAKSIDKKENQKDDISERYEKEIIRLLTTENNETKYEIANHLDIDLTKLKDWEKYRISTLLLRTVDDLGKYNKNNYNAILAAFMLPEYWEDRLKKNNITNESNALRILESMNEAASSSAISAKTSVTNDNLRKHAKSAFMKFDSNDAFRYLEDDFDKDFNALDEIRIHDALKTRHQKRALPPLIRWVAMAKNERFKAFLISEIAYFNQNENADQILEIFKINNNTTVKSAAAETLGKLKYDRATPSLISNYPYSNTKVQNSIIKALGNFKSQEVLDFLVKTYKEVHNKEIQILILEQIYKIDPTSNQFKKLRENSNSEFEKSIFDYIEQGYAV